MKQKPVGVRFITDPFYDRLAPPVGFEPTTNGIEARCSNPLSYGGYKYKRPLHVDVAAFYIVDFYSSSKKFSSDSIMDVIFGLLYP